jgi:hypothetical protein
MIQGYWIDKRCTSQKNLTGQTAVITGGKVRSFKREFLRDKVILVLVWKLPLGWHKEEPKLYWPAETKKGQR